MIKILGTCFGFFLLGAALALGMVNWPLRPGYMGAGFLVALAWFTRRYWQQRRNTVGDDPSMSERRTWLYMAGTAMICAYVVIVLLTPGSEVHRATGDTGGFDTWLMLGGGRPIE